jgi:hypothetical protein
MRRRQIFGNFEALHQIELAPEIDRCSEVGSI